MAAEESPTTGIRLEGNPQTEAEKVDRVGELLTCDETLSSDSEPESADAQDAQIGGRPSSASCEEKEASEAPKFGEAENGPLTANTGNDGSPNLDQHPPETSDDEGSQAASAVSSDDKSGKSVEPIEDVETEEEQENEEVSGVETISDSDTDSWTEKPKPVRTKRRAGRGRPGRGRGASRAVRGSGIGTPRRSRRAAADKASSSIKGLLGEEETREETESVSESESDVEARSQPEESQDAAEEEPAEESVLLAEDSDAAPAEETAPVLDSETGMIRTPSGTLLQPESGADGVPAAGSVSPTTATTSTTTTVVTTAAVGSASSAGPATAVVAATALGTVAVPTSQTPVTILISSVGGKQTPVVAAATSVPPSPNLLSNRIGKCMICENMRMVKYMLMANGSSTVHSLVCSDMCLNTLKQGRTRMGPLPQSVPLNTPVTVLAVPPLQVNTASATSAVPIRGAAPPVKPSSIELVIGGTNFCSNCRKPVLPSNQQRVVWETNLFCSLNCTIDYQKRDGANCVFCKSHLTDSALGKYCVRFGADVRQFCSTLCLDGFKKRLKVCSFCQRDITRFSGSFLAPVGDSTAQFKEFCSQSCLTRYKAAQTNSKPPTVETRCSVCNNFRPVLYRVAVKPEEAPKLLCSEPCLNACKFALSDEEIDLCAMCDNLMAFSKLERYSVWQGSIRTRLCSQSCSNVYVLANRRIVTCRFCKVKKYNFDMMDVLGEKDGLYCSVYCLMSSARSGAGAKAVTTSVASPVSALPQRMAVVTGQPPAAASTPPPADKPAKLLTSEPITVTGDIIRCAHCKTVISRHSQLRNANYQSVFCRHACLDAHNELAGIRTVPVSISSSPKVPGVTVVAVTPNTAVLSAADPVALARASSPERLSTASPAGSGGRSAAKNNSSRAAVKADAGCGLPTIESVMSLSERVVQRALSHPSVVVVPPPPPPLQRNVSVQARPRTAWDPSPPSVEQTSQTGELPDGVDRGTQTGADLETTRAVEALVAMEGSSAADRHVSTDTDDIPTSTSTAVTPPSARASTKDTRDPAVPEAAEDADVCVLTPEPKKVYIPIPIPVPFYVPVPMAMYNCPYPVPLPLVLPVPVPLPFPSARAITNGAAEPAVAPPARGSKRPRQDSAASDPSLGDGPDPDDPCSPSSPGGAGDDCEELDGRPPRKRTKGLEDAPLDLAAMMSAPTTLERSPRRGRMPVRQTEFLAEGDASQPCHNSSVKFTWCWKVYEEFVRRRNAAAEPAEEEEPPAEPDLLEATPAQLARNLTLLVTDLKRPGGKPYAPDLVHYILLGVQMQLAAGGRQDHLFCDEPYHPVEEALTERLQPMVDRVHDVLGDPLAHELRTHVEERQLWKARVLGAHTPLSLLTTVIYFSVKYFSLTRVEQLQKVSFSMLVYGSQKRQGVMTSYIRLSDADNLLGRKKQCIIWENAKDPFMCPVKFFEFYTSHCPPSVTSENSEAPLYLSLERRCRPEAAVWFGLNALPEPRLSGVLARVLTVREVQATLLSDAMIADAAPKRD